MSFHGASGAADRLLSKFAYKVIYGCKMCAKNQHQKLTYIKIDVDFKYTCEVINHTPPGQLLDVLNMHITDGQLPIDICSFILLFIRRAAVNRDFVNVLNIV